MLLPMKFLHKLTGGKVCKCVCFQLDQDSKEACSVQKTFSNSKGCTRMDCGRLLPTDFSLTNLLSNHLRQMKNYLSEERKATPTITPVLCQKMYVHSIMNHVSDYK